MLENSNIILICIIGLMILFFAIGNKPVKSSNEKFYSNSRPIYNYTTSKSIDDELMDEVKDEMNNSMSSGSYGSLNITKEHIKDNFVEIKFNNDYRDTLDAFLNIVPKRRQRFNIANIPIQYSEPSSYEVRNLIHDFIKMLNINIKNEVPECRNKNSGWDEKIPDPNIKSGFEDAQKVLGLPPSLYENPACKAPVRLIAIQRVQKYETEDEIKYLVQFVIQKINVEDQMVVKASFVQDKRPLQDENLFFVNKNIEMRIIIEDIFVLGYLSDNGPINRQQQVDADEEKYFNYDKLEENQLTDPKYIQKMLMKKYQERSIEMEQRNDLLDLEGRNFYRTLPSIFDYSNIAGTRTIFDDMNNNNKNNYS